MTKKTTNTIVCAAVIGGTVLLAAGLGHAEPPPSFSDAVGRANIFVRAVQQLLRNILNNSELMGIVNVQWTAMSVMLLVGVGIRYALSQVTLYDLVQPLMLVAVSRILIDNYNFLTGICWDFSEGVAGVIQTAGIGTNDLFFLPGFINDVIAGIHNNEVSIWIAFWPFMSVIVVFTIFYMLVGLGFVVNAWSLWGYCLSKIIGIFFVPFIMLKRTEFLFDGWLRLFAGFLVYNIIARANLLLMVIALKCFFNIPGNQVDTRLNIHWDITGLGDVVGLLAFVLIGLLSLISTGRFAATVVAGAGGFGGAVSSVVSMASQGLMAADRAANQKRRS